MMQVNAREKEIAGEGGSNSLGRTPNEITLKLADEHHPGLPDARFIDTHLLFFLEKRKNDLCYAEY